MRNPKVSVITVTYNSSNVLERTIKSVVSQEYNNMEYLIIDGLSQDETVEIAERYKPFISTIISEPDKGVYDAMNKGMLFASGEWVVFMNAGDVFCNNEVLKTIFSLDIEENTAILYGDTIYVYPFGKYRAPGLMKGKRNFCHQSTFFKLDVLKNFPYDLKFKIASDQNSYRKILENGWSEQYVPVDIAEYEAFSGLSSLRIVDRYKEMCEIKHRKKDIHFYKGLFDVYIKQLRMRFTPRSVYLTKKQRNVEFQYECVGENK